MISSKYFPTLVSGFAAGVLTTVPVIKSFSCCILVPLAVIFALYAEKRISKETQPIEMKHALTFGLFTGLFTVLFGNAFDTSITFITRSNDFVESYPDVIKMMKSMNFMPGTDREIKEALALLEQSRNDIIEKGFSWIYTSMTLFSNLIFYPLFGLLGGVLGRAFLERDTRARY